MKRRLKSAFLSIGLLFLLDPAGRANAALPRSAVWLSPFTYQTSQADAMAGNLAPITVSGTVNLSLQVTCDGLHFNLTAAAGCADSITSDHSCPAGQPTDLVSYPVGRTYSRISRLRLTSSRLIPRSYKTDFTTWVAALSTPPVARSTASALIRLVVTAMSY